jgi:hypothetical protein
MQDWMRRDAVWLAAAFAVGLVVLPPVVYMTGTKVLGAYAGGGLGTFLKDFYTSLFRFEPAALTLAVGPLAVAIVWRVLLRVSSAFAGPAATD